MSLESYGSKYASMFNTFETFLPIDKILKDIQYGTFSQLKTLDHWTSGPKFTGQRLKSLALGLWWSNINFKPCHRNQMLTMYEMEYNLSILLSIKVHSFKQIKHK